MHNISDNTCFLYIIKDFSLAHQQSFQLDLNVEKLYVFISHSPQQKHTRFHCLSAYLGVTYTKAVHCLWRYCVFLCEEKTVLFVVLHLWRDPLKNGEREVHWVQKRCGSAGGLVRVHQVTWSETMLSEWQMTHFECDCTALRADKRAWSRKQSVWVGRLTISQLAISIRITFLFIRCPVCLKTKGMSFLYRLSSH